MSNRTFTIIKPDSVRKGNFGKIISRLESEGFRILALKKVSLSKKQAEGFYAVHRERPFYRGLVEYMTSGPVYVAALERDNAVAHLRKVMGATDPKKADQGTIRAEFGESIEQNAMLNNKELEEKIGFQKREEEFMRKIEIGFFFPESELI